MKYKTKRSKRIITALFAAVMILTVFLLPAEKAGAYNMPGRDLYYGLSGDDVLSLQSILADYGYDCGPKDGVFGSNTERALMNYQADNGLAVDGIAGPSTLSSLYGSKSSSSQEDVSSGTLNPAKMLSLGTNGSDVMTLQSMLKDAGYYDESLDGDFGRYTENAVMAFQRDNGLAVDGIAGPVTLSALQNYSGSGKAAAKAETSEAASGAADITRSLSRGMSGSDVMTLQAALRDAGYYDEAVDGDFGMYTEYAVIAFQRDKGLYVDGIAGPITLSTLQKFTDAGDQTPDTGTDSAEIPESSASGSITADNYDAYLASIPSDLTKSAVEEAGRRLGLDSDELLIVIGWVQGEGYTRAGDPYLEYLSACTVVNGMLDGVYARGKAMYATIRTWGSYYSEDKLRYRYENASYTTLQAVYLAFTNRQDGIYYCRGANSKPANCFYDPGIIAQGQHIYVW